MKLIICVLLGLLPFAHLQEDYQPFQGVRHDSFDWQLSKTIFENSNSNVVYSPFLIKAILLMLAEASVQNSSTFNQLATVYPKLKVPDEARLVAFKNVSESLLKPSTSTVQTGVKIMLQNGLKPRSRYIQILQNYYDTTIESVDFAQAAEIVKSINSWAAGLTNNQLKNFVNEDDVQDAVMLLLNVIYFKGTWAQPFNEEKTATAKFQTPDGLVDTLFMNEENSFWHYNAEDVSSKVLRLPFSDGKLSMFIVLPKDIDEFTSNLVLFLSNRKSWNFEDMDVKVQLPKFGISSDLELKSNLESLGIYDIFSDNAAFSMFEKLENNNESNLKVSDIKQKAGIKVDELGSEAYAATVSKIVNKVDKGFVEFTANRPFIFFIEDETTGTILFVGKVTDPTKLN